MSICNIVPEMLRYSTTSTYMYNWLDCYLHSKPQIFIFENITNRFTYFNLQQAELNPKASGNRVDSLIWYLFQYMAISPICIQKMILLIYELIGQCSQIDLEIIKTGGSSTFLAIESSFPIPG